MAEPAPAGGLALVGSGEYTAAMNETDALLLKTLRQPARVATLPTASALEPGMPERWNAMGVAHFEALGARVSPLMLLTRADAEDPQIVATLREADFYYFSGGNPEYVAETLRETSALDVILARHRAGAVLAGCSAGAMMLGGAAFSVRSVRTGGPPRWLPALGLVPRLAVMPHFDRVAGFMGEALFRSVLASAPEEIVLLGIDEDTALVRMPGDARWHVTGRQTVSVFRDNGRPAIYRAGDTIELPG
jgi:cyanophycinase